MTDRIDRSKSWDKLKEIIENEDLVSLKKLTLEGDRIQQEGTTKDEVKEQLLAMAPGDHPHIHGVLKDYIAKLEWKATKAKAKEVLAKAKEKTAPITRPATAERIDGTEE